MGLELLYRPATVSKQAAITALFQKRPDADLVSFRRVTFKNGKFVDDPKGSEYEVKIRVAGGFPPPGEEDADASADLGDADKDIGKEEGDEATADKEEGDEAPDLGGGDDFGGGDDLGEKKPKKLKPEEEMVSLLRQLLDAVQGGASLGGPPGDGDLADPGMPPPGGHPGGPPGGMPPAGGPPHGGPGGPPLPPPVPKGPPMGGGGSFAHVASVSTFQFERADANTRGNDGIFRVAVSNRSLIQEANQLIPTHKVAKIERSGDKARLTMEKR